MLTPAPCPRGRFVRTPTDFIYGSQGATRLDLVPLLVGFILALAVFLMTFIRFRAGLSWPKASLYTGSGIGFMCFMAWVLNRDFPPGLLQSWFTLPWPLT